MGTLMGAFVPIVSFLRLTCEIFLISLVLELGAVLWVQVYLFGHYVISFMGVAVPIVSFPYEI